MSDYKTQLLKSKTKIIVNCGFCNKELILLQWVYNDRIKKSKTGKIYCNTKCSTLSRPEDIKQRDTERIRKIALSQKGMSRPECGRKGHPVSQETREKLRKAKTGTKNNPDYDIILRELQNQRYQKAAPMIGRIPDAVLFRDGKMIAFELEKKPWETDIRKKMALYDGNTIYDEVIIVWYNRQSQRVKEYRKIDGEWTVYTGDRD